MIYPLKWRKIQGLLYSITMTKMILGAPLISKSRVFSRTVILFQQWENEQSFNDFLKSKQLGQALQHSWFVKLKLVRQWGGISGLTTMEDENILKGRVAAVTLARMKFLQIPRFLKWGRPVEKLVRDHDGTILSLASIRYPNTISTFTIWKNLQEMKNMVHGHSQMPDSKRHIKAMRERQRKDFHYEFTTLRFEILEEFGERPY